MLFTPLLIHDVVVSNPSGGTTDRYGDLVPAATTATEKMRVQPASAEGSSEHLIDRDTRITRFKVFAKATTVVTGLSTLTWEGRSLRIDGEPLPFYGRTGLHHYEFQCEEILGG